MIDWTDRRTLIKIALTVAVVIGLAVIGVISYRNYQSNHYRHDLAVERCLDAIRQDSPNAQFSGLRAQKAGIDSGADAVLQGRNRTQDELRVNWVIDGSMSTPPSGAESSAAQTFSCKVLVLDNGEIIVYDDHIGQAN